MTIDQSEARELRVMMGPGDNNNFMVNQTPGGPRPSLSQN